MIGFTFSDFNAVVFNGSTFSLNLLITGLPVVDAGPTGFTLCTNESFLIAFTADCTCCIN